MSVFKLKQHSCFVNDNYKQNTTPRTNERTAGIKIDITKRTSISIFLDHVSNISTA